MIRLIEHHEKEHLKEIENQKIIKKYIEKHLEIIERRKKRNYKNHIPLINNKKDAQ